ncbi:arylsulfatase [Salinicoccus kekensis]|uniref:Arylsulfatase n=1 Tax=Salinicoccus kekensis TaxID=714307 RepID=A0A285UIK8_9STAP|nr:arylsulfatase [Salinicoccus kekensis]SOC41613.1 arylsulfatase [Salinicoccus kekensis]
MNVKREDKPWKKYVGKFAKLSTLALSAALLLGGETAGAAGGGGAGHQDMEGTEDKTNVMYIILDDAGFSDLGSFGSEIDTENIDAIAENGLKYNNFHTSPVCSPTRASLLTGRNNHAVGMGNVANFDFGEGQPNSRAKIPEEAGFVTEVLGENGYTNFGLGKWHITPTVELSPAGPYDRWPLGRGFHRYYGNLEDSSDQYRPELFRDNSPVPVPDVEDYHYSEDIVENGIQYITDHASLRPDDPFFMYLGFGAQHMPHQVPEEYIEMYEGEYDEGWDVIREERFERQKELGVIPEDAELAPRAEGIAAWDELNEEQQELYARFMETYAGFLTHTDEQIGKLVDHLEDMGELDNTLIMLISDNGASFSGGEQGTMNQAMAYNKVLQDFDHMYENMDEIGGERGGSDYPAGWAQVSNTPFEEFKGTTHAGGIRLPLIVHWPEGIESKGEVRDQFTHVSDLTATVYDVLGIEPPAHMNDTEQMEITGVSFSASFDDPEAFTGKDTQYFEHSGHRTIYHDGWKAVSVHEPGTDFSEDEWKLFDQTSDFSELNDLSDEYPEVLNNLIDIWHVEAEKNGALPLSENFLDGLGNLPADNLRARESFTFYPGMSHLSESASPLTLDRNYEITIPIELDEGDEGVLLALGNRNSGYTFYIKDGELHYEYNNGAERYTISSVIEAGANEIRYNFQNTGDNQGTGTLYINDEPAGEADVETLPFKIAFEGLDVGRDLLYPVSPAYEDEGDFEFTGEIEHVHYQFEEPEYIISEEVVTEGIPIQE